MIIKVIGKNIKITKSIEAFVEDRLAFLNKFLREDSAVTVKVSVEKETHKAEVLLTYKSQIIKIEESSNDLYESISKLSDRLKNQLSKCHELSIDRKKSAEIAPAEYIERKASTKKEVGKIVKRKDFSLKPMCEEEAILQMETLGHNSFMFNNADLDFTICLLYKRKDGNYGIIESDFEG